MLQERIWIQEQPVVPWIVAIEDQEVNRDEILEVLARAAEDDGFIARLTDHGAEALESYDLTWQEQAALLGGDIAWIEAHLGEKLDPQLRTWLDCRLQQEIW
jgi:hypothetical protein